MPLGRGDLLIASPSLLDPNFRRSVVLLCDHGEEGSLGFVLNRPMQVPLGSVIEKLRDQAAAGLLVFQGGPVDPGRLLGIRRGEHAAERSEPLGGGLHLLTDLEHSLDRLAEGVVDGADYRFFLGYSGWGKGQLRGELAERAWIVGKGSEALAFGTPTPRQWSAALEALGGTYALYARMPIDPELN